MKQKNPHIPAMKQKSKKLPHRCDKRPLESDRKAIQESFEKDMYCNLGKKYKALDDFLDYLIDEDIDYGF